MQHDNAPCWQGPRRLWVALGHPSTNPRIAALASTRARYRCVRQARSGRAAGQRSSASPSRSHQTTVPNTFPMPAVKAIASAPQNVTRAVPRRMFAPPARAPIAPRKARKARDAADTMATSAPAGDTKTMSRGMAAPTENDAADVSAACTGRAVVISEIPSSSRAWALRASFAINCWATCRATASSTPRLT